MKDCSRRRFLEFVSAGAAGLVIIPRGLFAGDVAKTIVLSSLTEDGIVLHEGCEFYFLIQEGESFAGSAVFGANNDFTAVLPIKNATQGRYWLMVNHESPNSNLHDSLASIKTKQLINIEQKEVGCSVLEIEKDAKSGKWSAVKDSKDSFRLDGTSVIDFIKSSGKLRKRNAVGTFANCSGGVTPWGTFLSCEENYDEYYGVSTAAQKEKDFKTKYGWQKFYKRSPEDYGWVVEIVPELKKARKLVALGRFMHEGALVVSAKDNRAVVYMGDDSAGKCFYKFIADKPGSLIRGTLYVANIEKGQWVPLDVKSNKELKSKFKNQDALLTETRKAAVIAGGTPLDRPEGAARNPLTGDVFLSLSNNIEEENYFGSIMAFSEKENDPLSLEFSSRTFIAGNDEFACPDNLCFDAKGGLWVTTDVSSKNLGKDKYARFASNGLYHVPTQGKNVGVVTRIASAPNGAEFTGPCILPDGESLLLSVQHPGELAKSGDKLASHWPSKDPNDAPKSATIVLRGKLIRDLLA